MSFSCYKLSLNTLLDIHVQGFVKNKQNPLQIMNLEAHSYHISTNNVSGYTEFPDYTNSASGKQLRLFLALGWKGVLSVSYLEGMSRIEM